MSGYDEARRQRNVLERLGEKIPGFRGFQDRELRRDVDRRQREYLAERLRRVKGTLREGARAYTDAGRIAELGPFDRLDKRLEGLSQEVRFADYGASGLFDAEKIGEAELERLYAFDLALLEDIERLEELAAAVAAPGVGRGGAGAPDPLAELLDLTARLEETWAERDRVVGGVVATRAGG